MIIAFFLCNDLHPPEFFKIKFCPLNDEKNIPYRLIVSGQIIATSHDRFPPNGGLVREMGPLISGKSGLVKYYNLAR